MKKILLCVLLALTLILPSVLTSCGTDPGKNDPTVIDAENNEPGGEEGKEEETPKQNSTGDIELPRVPIH